MLSNREAMAHLPLLKAHLVVAVIHRHICSKAVPQAASRRVNPATVHPPDNQCKVCHLSSMAELLLVLLDMACHLHSNNRWEARCPRSRCSHSMACPRLSRCSKADLLCVRQWVRQ